MTPETKAAVNDLRDAQAYRAIKPEMELMAKKAAMFDELVKMLEDAAYTFNDFHMYFVLLDKSPSNQEALKIAKNACWDLVARARELK